MKQLFFFSIATLLISSKALLADQSALQQNGPVSTCDTRSGPFVTGDYLYWQASQDNMSYAMIALDYTPSSQGPPPTIEVALQKPHLASGFRIGLGYNLPYHLLALSLEWTRFVTSSTSIVSSHNPTTLIGASGFFNAVPSGASLALGDSASADWHLRMNMLELMASHHFSINENISFFPKIGLIGGWINQSQFTAYNNFVDYSNHNASVNASVNRTSRMAAIGPKIEIMARWRLGKQFGLFGNLGVAALYGLLKSGNQFFIDEEGFTPENFAIDSDFHSLFPTAQIQLGLDWSYCVANWLLLHVAASYEIQYWWKQWGQFTNINQVLFPGTPDRGDLQFQGLTLHFDIGF